MIEVSEKHGAREGSAGLAPWHQRVYTVRGTDDHAVVVGAVSDFAPHTVDPYGTGIITLQRETIDPREIADGCWEVTVRWSFNPSGSEAVFSFDTGGGTQHITQSFQTVGRYPPAAPNQEGAIGVTPDAVEGVDITVPVYNWTETYVVPAVLVDPMYQLAIFQLTGHFNASPWRLFAAGEVLFLGACGGKRGLGDWEMTFKFAASPNQENLQIGSITGIVKRGWDYLWVLYEDAHDTSAHRLVKRPVGVYVEQVYLPGDFSRLGI